jgi:hypothetical protein
VNALKQPLRFLWAAYGYHFNSGQSDEAQVIDRLVEQVGAPHNFCEFGFHIKEFNTTRLAKRWPGLLIDGNPRTNRMARRFLPARVEVKDLFLTVETMQVIKDHFAKTGLGVLSVDVDGNDYWFLEQLLPLDPAVIVVEYNPSMLARRISVPYDPAFDRNDKHPTGWYHGASLAAMSALCERHGYDLVAISRLGINAFYVKAATRPASLPKLDPVKDFRESVLRNQRSGTNSAQQYERIKDMPFVEV